MLVALTGYGQESTRQQAKESGFDYYLVKPVGVDALENVLLSLAHAEPGNTPDPGRVNAGQL